MIGDGRLRVGRCAGEPGLVDQIRGSQSLGTGIVNFRKDEGPLLQFPGVNAGIQVTEGIIEKRKTILRDSKGAKTAPTGDGMIDSKDALIKLKFPHAAFQCVIRTTYARKWSLRAWIDFYIGGIKNGWFFGWERCCPRDRRM